MQQPFEIAFITKNSNPLTNKLINKITVHFDLKMIFFCCVSHTLKLFHLECLGENS